MTSVVVKQALIQVAAAIVAAWLVGHVPEVRRYVRDQWGKP